MANEHEGLGLPGKHRGNVEESHTGQNVRVENPEAPQGHPGQKTLRTYQFQEFRNVAGELPPDAQIAVFENSQTGETYIDAIKHVTADWSIVGSYDRVAIFDSQSEAEAYVASLQRDRS